MKLRYIVLILVLAFLMIKGCRAWADWQDEGYIIKSSEELTDETNLHNDYWIGKEVIVKDENREEWKGIVSYISEDGQRMTTSCYELIEKKPREITEQEYRQRMLEAIE